MHAYFSVVGFDWVVRAAEISPPRGICALAGFHVAGSEFASACLALDARTRCNMLLLGDRKSVV